MKQEILFYGGTVLPMTAPDAATEALLVRDGRIAFVGALADAEAQCAADAQRVNLHGKALLPSFIDAHSHLPMAAQFAAFADLGDCTTLPQIADTLRRYAAEKGIGADGAIVGVNYDNNFLAEGVHPDRQLLDNVSAEIPICAACLRPHGRGKHEAAGTLRLYRRKPRPRGWPPWPRRGRPLDRLSGGGQCPDPGHDADVRAH